MLPLAPRETNPGIPSNHSRIGSALSVAMAVPIISLLVVEVAGMISPLVVATSMAQTEGTSSLQVEETTADPVEEAASRVSGQGVAEGRIPVTTSPKFPSMCCWLKTCLDIPRPFTNGMTARTAYGQRFC